MVSFKKLQNGPCTPGDNQVSYKDKVPAPGPVLPPQLPPIPGDICSCLGDKLDTIASEIQQTYDSGPEFNARDPITGSNKLFTEAATPIEIDATITSFNPNVVGWYNNIDVATTRGNINVPLLWVIADPDGAVDPNDPFLYVRVSNGGVSTFNGEVAVRIGEDFGFRDVYSLRIRGHLAGQQFRVTSNVHHTTYVSTVVNIPPGPSSSITTPPVANRPNFTTLNVNIPLPNIDQQLNPLVIPNGFALVIRSNPFNTGNSKIWVSNNNAMFVGQRNTLAPGDSVKLYITNVDLVHVASNLANQTVDIMVEQ